MEERTIVVTGDVNDPQIQKTTKLLEEADVGKVVVVGAGHQSIAKRLLLTDAMSKVFDLKIPNTFRTPVVMPRTEDSVTPFVSDKMMALLSRGVEFPPRRKRTEDQQG